MEVTIPEPEFIIGIDFGTSRSAVVGLRLDNHEHYDINSWDAPQGGSPFKFPTCILYKGSIPQEIGWEAERKFVNLKTEERSGYKLIRFFKMAIKQVKYRDLYENIPVIRIITDFLSILKKHIWEKFKYLVRSLDSFRHIRVCLTVPAIWSDADKQIMATAAFKAGLVKSSMAISSGELVIVLEPEAAAAYFLKYYSLKEQSFDIDDKTLLVIDGGAGTVDMTIHKIISKTAMKEVLRGDGNVYGGNDVNEKFEEFFKEQFKVNEFNDHFNRNLKLKFDIETSFERFKCNKNDCQNSQLNLPPILLKLKRPDAKIQKNEAGFVELTVTEKDWKKFWEMTLEQTKKKLLSLLDQVTKRKLRIDYVFLVGGLSNSPLFTDTVLTLLYSVHNGIIARIPKNPEVIVARGSSYFGENMDLVISRISRATYGLSIMEKWDEKKHRGRQPWINSETKEKWCKDVFHKLVDIDEDCNKEFSRSLTVTTQYSYQRVISLDFYYINSGIDNPDKCINTKDYTLAGRISVIIPKVKNPRVHVKLYFGRSIVQAEAHNESDPKDLYSLGLIGGELHPKYHFLLIIDHSDSMHDTSQCPERGSPFYEKQNNRLGAVFQAILTLIKCRLDTDQIDIFSLIKFNHYASIIFKKETFTTEKDFINKVENIYPNGLTNYCEALNCALGLLTEKKEKDQEVVPVIVFLSDGDNMSKEDPIMLLGKLLEVAPKLSFNTIFVGKSDDKSVNAEQRLKEMAHSGNGTFHSCNEVDHLLSSFEMIAATLQYQ